MSHPDEKAALAAIEKLRAMGHPAVEACEKALDDLRSGRREGLKINVAITATLEKFDGEHVPGSGQQPVETLHLEG